MIDHKAAAGVTDPALASLLTDHWEAMLLRHPTFASRLGDRRGDGLLHGTAPADHEAGRVECNSFLAKAREIDAETLGAEDRLTHRLFVTSLETDREVGEFRSEEWSLLPRWNPLTVLGWLPQIRPLESDEDRASLVARYRAFSDYVDGEIETLRLGVATERVSNAVSVRNVIEMVAAELAKPTGEWASAVDDDAITALDEVARPALARYGEFLEHELLPKAREGEHVGLSGLPEGPDLYPALIRQYTTLPLTSDQIFETGEEELRGIHAEFAEIGNRVFGTREISDIFHHLRTDPELRFKTAEEVEEKAASALDAARRAIPDWFGRLPEAECVVVRIPDHEAPYTTVAYYRPPPGQGAGPGEYRINVHEPETRPRHEAEALAFHESIPGHHLQIAIAQELPELPAFRRHGGFTAYVEGWALYTERLADEMGLYTGDVDRLGMLAFDAWRAARLVVDSGIHDRGWSRERAEKYLREMTPLALNNIENEVDRYISWPGQALSYKIGQREVWRIRREAEAALGDGFSLPDWHDAVLDGGALPLTILSERVRERLGY